MLTAEQRRHWEDNGFLVLKSFFSGQRIDEANALIDSLWTSRQDARNPLVIDVFISKPESKRMYFKDAPAESRRAPYKLNDVYLEHGALRELILDPGLCGVIQGMLQGTPVVCNSLNFEYGSQQPDHIDTFYMPPRVPNKLVASWIALEDVSEKNGALRYYPGSHKVPPYLFSHGRVSAIQSEMDAFYTYIHRELARLNIKPAVFCAEKGDVFIWHAQLLHGGAPILDPGATRKSLVTHYHRAKDFIPRGWWRLRKSGGGYYVKRPHQPVGA